MPRSKHSAMRSRAATHVEEMMQGDIGDTGRYTAYKHAGGLDVLFENWRRTCRAEGRRSRKSSGERWQAQSRMSRSRGDGSWRGSESSG
jgi:hypothetical protein